jgi:hypothetical protein
VLRVRGLVGCRKRTVNAKGLVILIVNANAQIWWFGYCVYFWGGERKKQLVTVGKSKKQTFLLVEIVFDKML